MYPLPVLKQEAAKTDGKLRIRYACDYHCCVTLYGIVVNFCGIQAFMDFVRLLNHEVLPYSGKTSRTITFAVFEDLTAGSKINSSKSCYSIESYIIFRCQDKGS